MRDESHASGAGQVAKGGGGRRCEVVVSAPRRRGCGREVLEMCVQVFRECGEAANISLQTLTLVCRGRKVTASTLALLQDGDVVMAIGKEHEDETGCHDDDIAVLVRQLQIDRDRAVVLLRNNSFDLVDALLNS
ncbi:hypothetical protein T484DRAFT_1902970 [Baffinella frigidus]|nr:hypothetical protein T484DRAFT_1902970 [Cryptophyta sp. CCMP2293]